MTIIEKNAIYTSSELAELLNVQERVIWNLLGNGDLRGKKIGRIWRVTGKSLLRYLNQTPNAVSSHIKPQKPKKDIILKATSNAVETTSNAVIDGLPELQGTPREQRRQAVQIAYEQTGGNTAAAELLNSWRSLGGPTPERGEEWTSNRVRQSLAALRKQK